MEAVEAEAEKGRTEADAEQLQQVLGSDTAKQLAARFNIPLDQISKILAEQLPKAVDGASPNGTLPASS